MKYYVSGKRQNPGSKDIGAFYGLNRTAKINDFQLSEMQNIDCEFFPYAGTRRERVKIFENMAVIASDSDVGTSEYQVTGVTEGGSFIYRGEDMGPIRRDSLSLLENLDDDMTIPDMELQGGASSSEHGMYLAEYSGDYVCFPSMDVITVANGEMAVTSFKSTGDDYETDMKDMSPSIYEDAGVVCCNDAGKGSIVIRTGNTRKSECRPIAKEFIGLISSGKLLAGKSIVLSMYYHEITDHDAAIPDDVYEVVSYVKVTGGSKGDVLYASGLPDTDPKCQNVDDIFDAGREEYVRESFEIEIGFDAYDGGGQPANISAYFYEARHPYDAKEGGSTEPFEIGSWETSYRYNDPKYSNLKIAFIENAMVMGEAFGGRLFTLDQQGVTVYYSSAAGKYDFQQRGVSGGAGFILCSDPGKWTGMQVYHESLYVFKRNSMYRISSSDGLSFYMDKIAEIGAVSANGICVVDDIMYFLSVDGLYRFSGSYPQLLPDSLGRQYTGGALGGCDGKVFCSLRYKEGLEEKSELIVWHPDKNIYSRHDDLRVSQFLYAYGMCYALDQDGCVHQMEGERSAVPFSLETKEYFFGFAKKAVNAIRVYFEYEPSTYVDDETGEVVPCGLVIEASYDGGEWEKCHKPIRDGRVRYVPIKFKKCDEFKLKISGCGVFDLKGLSFSVYQGGDIRQNHMMKYMKF